MTAILIFRSFARLHRLNHSACAFNTRILSDILSNSTYTITGNKVWTKFVRYNSTECQSRSTKEEIYTAPFDRKLLILKITTLTTSGFGFLLLQHFHSKVAFPSPTIMYLSFTALSMFNFLTPFLINLVAKKYCTKMFYDHANKCYELEFYTLFFKKNNISFTPKDVDVPAIPGLLTVAIIKGHPLFFQPDHFTNVEYYKNIMGHDKIEELQNTSHESNQSD